MAQDAPAGVVGEFGLGHAPPLHPWLTGPAVDLAPAGLRRRVFGRVDQPWGSVRSWALVAAGALVGSATHVGWDAFTHPGAWGPEHLPVLRLQLGPLSMTKWLQYASGVLGLVGLLVWWWAELRSRPSVRREPQVRAWRSSPRATPAVGLAVGVVASWRRWVPARGRTASWFERSPRVGSAARWVRSRTVSGGTLLRRQQRPLPDTVEAARTFEEH